MRVDLITGFLGAGKTTFIRRYAAFWRETGEKVRIIENEFGSVAVDKQFLCDENVPIDDLSGCCMCCTGKEKFKQMLVSAALDGTHRVIVEPSGIYDVDEFFSVMQNDRVKAHCEIGSILLIVDPEEDPGLSAETRSLMQTQLLAAGMVIVSKTQLYPDRKPEDILREYAQLTDAPVCVKEWDRLGDEDFLQMAQSGYCHKEHSRRLFDHEETYQSCMLADLCDGEEDLRDRLSRLFAAPGDDPQRPAIGQILRVKGYIRSLDGAWYAVNCTRQETQIEKADVRRGLLVVIGQSLDEEAVHSFFIPREKRKKTRE